MRPIRKYVSPGFDDLLKNLGSGLRDIGVDIPEHKLSDAIAKSFRKGPAPIIVIQVPYRRGRPPGLGGGFSL